jgi:hypothetical protein
MSKILLRQHLPLDQKTRTLEFKKKKQKTQTLILQDARYYRQILQIIKINYLIKSMTKREEW